MAVWLGPMAASIGCIDKYGAPHAIGFATACDAVRLMDVAADDGHWARSGHMLQQKAAPAAAIHVARFWPVADDVNLIRDFSEGRQTVQRCRVTHTIVACVHTAFCHWIASHRILMLGSCTRALPLPQSTACSRSLNVVPSSRNALTFCCRR